MGYTIKHSRISQLIDNPNRAIHIKKDNFKEYKSHISAISTKAKPIVEVLQSGIWKGHRCFILGGGPSLANLNFQDIENELTIGINKSFTKFNTTINYSMDQRFYDYLVRYDKRQGEDALLYEQWKAYRGIKVFLEGSDKFQFESDVHIINRLSERIICLNLSKGIYAGNNAGFGAIMLAAALGANPIYLLGYDMKVSGQQTHWHNGYPDITPKFLSTRLKKYVKTISEFADSYEAANINVVNLTPDSALTCFKNSTLSEVLQKRRNISMPTPSNGVDKKLKPVIVSFYTKDTEYEKEARNLIESLDKLHLDYDIVPINNTGNWQKNVRYKPSLIKNMLQKYAPRPVLYVDCDAVFMSPPILFDDFDSDFALYKLHWADFGRPHRDDELLGGTVYAANNERVFKILDLWIRECDVQPLSVWDQKILYGIIGDGFYNLPPEYCTIFDVMKSVENPVIKQYQASRKLKRSVRRGIKLASIRRKSRA